MYDDLEFTANQVCFFPKTGSDSRKMDRNWGYDWSDEIFNEKRCVCWIDKTYRSHDSILLWVYKWMAPKVGLEQFMFH